jgi:hypothetical protein
LLGACGASEDREAEEPRAKKKRDPDPVSSKGKKWGGWRWKGKGDDCFFMVKQRCYNSIKKACRAAKCKRKDKRCLKDDSAPALVYCQGDRKPVPGERDRAEKAKRKKAKKKSNKKKKSKKDE